MHEFNPKELTKLFLPKPDSHKGQNGKVLVIAGSKLFHAAALWSLQAVSHLSDMVYFLAQHFRGHQDYPAGADIKSFGICFCIYTDNSVIRQLTALVYDCTANIAVASKSDIGQGNHILQL